jgi:Ca2+-binding EF-hand superfamily protein
VSEERQTTLRDQEKQTAVALSGTVLSSTRDTCGLFFEGSFKMEFNKIWVAGAAGALVLVAGAVALASDWSGGPKRGRTNANGLTFTAMRLIPFDANKDGRITREEINGGIMAQFNTADTNQDGKLDAAEILRFNDQRRAERRARYDAWKAKAAALGVDPGRPPSDRDSVDNLRVADWNLDGVITPDEFGGKMRAIAMRADRNGDGTVDAEELKPRQTKRGKDGGASAPQ